MKTRYIVGGVTAVVGLFMASLAQAMTQTPFGPLLLLAVGLGLVSAGVDTALGLRYRSGEK